MERFVIVLLAIALFSSCGDDTDAAGEPGMQLNNVASNNSSNGSPNSTSPNNSAANNSATDAGMPNNGASDAGMPNNAATNPNNTTDAGMNTEPDTGEVDMTQPPGDYGDPGMAGTFAVATSNTSVALGGDNIPVTIYAPMAAGTYPVVVFHHGFQLSPDLYASYGERLASWGYVAVFPDMPTAFFGGPTHVDLKDNVVELLDWIEMEAGNGSLAVDTQSIGLAGHSLGGKVSMLTATEDARVAAVFAIDPVDSAPPGTFDRTNYPSVTPELMPQISAPLGIVGETVNASCSGLFCQSCAPGDENFEQYYAAAVSPAYVMDVLQANHMSFLDNPDCGFTCDACDPGTDDPAVTRSLTQRAMIAFFDLTLRGEERARPYLTGPPADMAVSGLATYETKNGF